MDAYIERSADFARPILEYLRDAVHAAAPDAEETMKWGFPHFTDHGIVCSMASFKEHCTFAFWKGSLVVGELDSADDAMGQFGRIAAVSDLPSKKTLIGYVRKAVKLNREGVKDPTRPKRKPRGEVEVPEDFRAALKKDKKAQAAFDAFPPSHRREYVEWIMEAKREETRLKRMTTALEWLAEGKPRNWKHMK